MSVNLMMLIWVVVVQIGKADACHFIMSYDIGTRKVNKVFIVVVSNWSSCIQIITLKKSSQSVPKTHLILIFVAFPGPDSDPKCNMQMD